MKRREALLGAGLVVAIAAPVHAQAGVEDDAAWQAEIAEQFEAGMADAIQLAGLPGARHQALDPLVGDWQTTVRRWTEPGAEPVVSHGVASYRWTMGGRFLLEEASESREGAPFRTMAFIGFNNHSGEYERARVDDTSTAVRLSAGSLSGPGDELTWTARYPAPVDGAWIDARGVVTFVAPNEMRYVGYEGKEGEERKVVEITFTRS